MIYFNRDTIYFLKYNYIHNKNMICIMLIIFNIINYVIHIQCCTDICFEVTRYRYKY